MNGKIIWSDVVEPGVATITLQANLGVGLMLFDQQLWCEAHQKSCNRFMFGVISDDIFLGRSFMELKPPSGGI